MSKCVCGNLERWVTDPAAHVAYHAETDSYSLDLSSEVSVTDMFCMFCGGQGRPTLEATEPKCRCGCLEKWASDPNLPIEFDAEMNEYNLIRGNSCRMIYFCPVCGGRTPKSRRAQFFTEPSRADMHQICSRLSGAQTVADVVAILGEPDERHQYPAEERQVYHAKGVLRYSSLSGSFHLFVIEQKDGTIGGLAFPGKYKGKG